MAFGLVIIFCSCNPKAPVLEKTKRPVNAKVDGYIVKFSKLQSDIDIPGSILPFETTEIHPEISGKVVQMNIVEGAFVSKGQLLARLFDGDLQAQIGKSRIQLQIAQKTQERQSQLLKIGGISQQDYDLSLLNASNVRADMQVLQANVNKTIIRAPFSGKLGFKNISIGAFVTPATVVTTINQVNQLKLEFSIPEKYQSDVTMGHMITFSMEGTQKKYNAKVIATEAGISQNNRSLKVRAIIMARDKFLKPGIFVKVNFNMGEDSKAIMIPSQAIIPGARDKKVIIAKNGKASFQTVQTSVRDSANVQVINGLSVGDTVVTSGLLSIKPGTSIQIKLPRK